jgi:hypothetical protein
MATRIGIKEFRDNFTKIAREATGPVHVTNQNKIVGTYTPAVLFPKPTAQSIKALNTAIDAIQADLAARGVDVAAKLRDIGINEWGEPIDDQ